LGGRFGGPLGVRIEPLGKTSFEEARAAFREQITALVEGGVDLLILETFGYVEELHQAILAARDVNPRIPVVAHVTIDEDGNCLDGSTPESFTPRIESWGVDVLGCNCSVGPVAMLDVIERVRALTSLPLAAQPNAGMPRSVEGRNIYLCSPEYMASYARSSWLPESAWWADAADDAGAYPGHEIGVAGGEARAKTSPSKSSE
jgi:homocysteine S-methyltransferase